MDEPKSNAAKALKLYIRTRSRLGTDEGTIADELATVADYIADLEADDESTIIDRAAIQAVKRIGRLAIKRFVHKTLIG